jgi:hypothetical protein
MFVPVFENMRTLTAAAAGMQQEMFKKWLSLWPGAPVMPTGPVGAEQIQQLQRRWAEAVGELLRRQRESIDAQFKAGQQNITKAFQLGEIKDPEEMRARTVELWQKCFEAVVQLSEAQARDFQAAVQKWFELVTPPVPSA